MLCYIANETRFKTSVAKWVQIIRDLSNVEEWKYVATNQNPADDASHGNRVCAISKNSRWFKGPEFLWKSENKWPREKVKPLLNDDDLELRKAINVKCATVVSQDSVLVEIENIYSDWVHMKRVVALLLEFISKCKGKKRNKEEIVLSKANNEDRIINVEDLQMAEITIMRLVQEVAFEVEVKELKEVSTNDKISRFERRNLKKCSSLFKLDPFLDKHEILRLGGRLSKSCFDDDGKHPIILPKKGKVIDVIIE